MRLTATFVTHLTLVALLASAACSGSGNTSSSAAGSSSASSTGSAAGGSSSGSGQGPGTSSSAGSATGGSGSGTGTGTATGAEGATSGSTTGLIPPTFVDGGYVSCSLPSAPDAGPTGDGGPASWVCAPGTYFCDLGGNLGNCLQCRSDADCANRSLPTYDPGRPHCDLSSGVFGYQNFCQQCLTDADCTGNPNGDACDINPAFPPGAIEPPIVDVGFETCNEVVTDCRVDGGPVCGSVNQVCDPSSGRCTTRSGACQTDQDCKGYLSPYNAYLPAPYCTDAGCNTCPDGLCPNGFCTSDDQCSGGTICDLSTYQCSCTDSSQCGGLWPVCEDLDAGRVNDAGQVLGLCGCDDTEQCEDGGLICLVSTSGLPSSCGLSCASPEFPACRVATLYPVCDAATGACVPCTNDNQCRDGIDTGGPRCDYLGGGSGACGCTPGGQDCPVGETCQTGPFLGSCAAGLPRCTAGSCQSSFCDWDAGSCSDSTSSTSPSCITDYDCAVVGGGNSLCEKGRCIGCRSSADCLNSGAAAAGDSLCCLPGMLDCETAGYPNNICVDLCATDQDCAGNYYGPSCVVADSGFPPRCGCGSDKDCAGYVYGTHCDRDPSDPSDGYCNCVTNSDCAAGEACVIYSGNTGFCGASCYGVDSGYCGPNYFCDPSDTCRPRCDNGYQCQDKDQACDTQNAAGQNGLLSGAEDPGVTWCYTCLQASDCPAGQGCDPKHGCGLCTDSAECPTGTVCIDGGICQPGCASAACPKGEVCDTLGLGGYGPNVCLGCLSPEDCPNGEGCDDQSHTCGTCYGPSAAGGPNDCPPDAICSNYWSPGKSYTPGVCLANCDRTSCPASEPICAVYPGLTPDHKFCFGCLQDSDCRAGQRCNLSPNSTFTCVSAQ